jgi:hypothetical protein
MPLSPRTLRPANNVFTPKSISGLALWLDGEDASTTYTTDAGPVVAVTQPTDISGCVGWWDASDAASVTRDGSNRVSAFSSKVAGAPTLTASVSNQPLYSPTGLNGLGVINVDSASRFLDNATAQSIGFWIAVLVPTGTESYGSFFSFSDKHGLIRLATGNTAYFSAVSMFGSTSFRNNGLAGSTTFGTTAAIFAAGGAPETRAFRIRTDSAGGMAATGLFAEAILFSSQPSSTDIARVEAYLATKWGISGVHTPATATSDPVGAWLDKSGNARHLTQSTAGNRPLVGTQNGRKALTFDGTNDNVSLTPASPVGSSAYTVVAAVKHNLTSQPLYLASPLSLTASNQGRPIERWQGGSSQSIVTIGAVTSNVGGSYRSFPDRFVYGLDALKDGISSGTHQVREFLNGATNFDLSNNGSWAVTSQRINIGTRDDNGTQYKGDICELLVYDRRLTTAERQRAERYLAARWDITLAPQVSNADAQDWINRVYANGGTVSASTAAAVNQFCTDIENAPGGSIRDRFYRLNLFCGSNLNAALVPLYRGPSLGGAPLGNAIDTNNGPFATGAYTEATGLTPVFASGHHLDTGLTPDAMPLSVVQAMHLAFSHGPIPAAGFSAYPHLIGAANNPADRHYLGSFEMPTSGSAALVGQLGKTASTNAAVLLGANPSSSWVVSRTNATSLAIYKNGSLANTPNTSSTTGIASYSRSFWVFRTNFNGSPLGDSISIPGRHYSIGAGLTGPEVSSYNSALSSFFSAIVRTA